MQCPAWEQARYEMYEDFRQADILVYNLDTLLDDTPNLLKYLMGG